MPLRLTVTVIAVLGAALACVIVLAGAGSSHADAKASARPVVGFTRPAANAIVSGDVLVVARVSKAPAINRVEFRVDGKLRWTDRRRPFVMYGDQGRLRTSSLSTGAHKLSITAYATNGTRRTAERRIRVRRGAAGGGAGLPPAPAQVPLSPAPPSLRVTGAGTSSISLDWDPAPGATSYGIVIDGRRIASTADTAYTIGGLSCGIAHRIAVDGAQGTSRTAKAVVDTATAGCPPPSVFVAPGGSDAAACSQAAPCQSLGRGYRVAGAGQVVEAAAGTYSGSIDFDAAKVGATSRVVIRPAAGASVRVSGVLGVDAEHLELRDMAIDQWQTYTRANDVVFRNVSQGLFYVNSSQNISVIGGQAGPSVNAHPQIQSDTTTPPRGILIDGVAFHDFTRNDPNVHTECLQIGAGDGVTVRNSRFRNCHATGNMHVTHWGPSPETRNVTIENNFFSATVDGFYAIQANAYENLLVRNNSALQGILLFERGPVRNVRVVANLAPLNAWECLAGVTYRSNVWFTSGGSPARCHSSDTPLANTANPGFVNPGALDLHLTAASAAVGRGSSPDAAENDIDGTVRASGDDAGADER